MFNQLPPIKQHPRSPLPQAGSARLAVAVLFGLLVIQLITVSMIFLDRSERLEFKHRIVEDCLTDPNFKDLFIQEPVGKCRHLPVRLQTKV